MPAIPDAHSATSAKSVFNQLNTCARTKSVGDCREHVTADSVAMFDRFNGYGLATCLPDDVRFVSETPSGDTTVIRAKTNVGNKLRFMRLVFSREEDEWKLDVPASLERGMGEHWKNNIALMEALYVALRQQMGNKLDCNAARALAK